MSWDSRSRTGTRGAACRCPRDRACDARELQRIDVAQSFSSALALVDMPLAGYFAAMSLRLALAAGDRRRVANALFQVSWFVGSRHPSAAGRLEEWAQYQKALAAELGELRFEANVALARSCARYTWGHWREGRDAALEAEALYEKCQGVSSELHYARIFGVFSRSLLGDAKGERELVSKLSEQARDRDNVLSRAILVMGYGHMKLLADDAEGSLRETELALERWPRRQFGYVHLNNLCARMLAWLYLGEGAKAASEVEKAWPTARRSLLVFMPFGRALLNVVRGMAAVGGAKALPEHLETARSSSHIIRSSGVAGFYGFADMIEAGTACVAGERVLAAKALERAIALFERHEMSEWATASRGQLARLRGDEEALADAHAALSANGAVRPDRMMAALVPGFDGV